MNTQNSQLQKTSKMLDEKKFWKLIEDSRNNCGYFQSQHEYLIDKMVETLSPQEIIEFEARFYSVHKAIQNKNTHNALFGVRSPFTDDGFHYFISWVISHGKAFYNQVKNKPNTINEVFSYDDTYELFGYVASEAFERKLEGFSTNDDISDYIDYSSL